MAEGEAAAAEIAEAGRRTTSRRELSRREHFVEISPEVGRLDADAFDELLGEDPDEALSLLADMNGATDRTLRELARRLAGQILVDLAREGTSVHRGVGRLARRPAIQVQGDLDVDASLDEIVAASAARRPPDVDRLVTAAWERPDTAICLLVDRSGSMHGARLSAAALSAAAVVLRAPMDSSVVAFADRAVVVASQGIARAPEDVVRDLLALRGHGVTDLGLALRTARSQLERSGAGRRLTILLSDCRATAGGAYLADAAALDELAIIAPAGDSDDAVALADALGARCSAVHGPTDVTAALAVALSTTR